MDDLNYLDLIILKKIDTESTVEKFGTQINTSFFETANILGTLKVKGLIEIETSIGGQSPVRLTDEGREIIEHASRKASEEIDQLDRAALSALAGGMKDLRAISDAINIRPKDLAFHLNKLKVSDYIDYDVRSGKVTLTLTEKGFIFTGGKKSVQQPQESGQQHAAHSSSTPQSAQKSSSAANPQGSAQQIANLPPSALNIPLSKPKAQGMWAALFGSPKKPEDKKKATSSDIAEIIGQDEKPSSSSSPSPSSPSATSPSPSSSTSSSASPSSAPASSSGSAPWAKNVERQPKNFESSPGNAPWAKPAGAKPSSLIAPPWAPAKPSAQPASQNAAGAKPNSPQYASSTSQKFSPQRTLADVAEEKPSRPEDIKAARLRSKMRYYLETYLGYAVMALILIGVILFFISLAGNYPLVA